MSLGVTEPDILTEVPESLKRLARYIVRGFYGVEHAIVIDLLVRNPCMKEDDLVELLKFDRKQLRTLINTLKNDKFLKIRMRVETDAEGKATRHNYYFINYKIFVNVVKYKLDHMRRKIETEERDSSNRASFKCPGCQKSFTDLEVDRLFDPMMEMYRCYFCSSEVVEDEPINPVHDTRTLMAKFNHEMQPIYDLLRECEDVRLAPEILDPEPIDIKAINSRAPGASKKDTNNEHSVWSGDMKKNIGFQVRETIVSVNMEGDKPITAEKKLEKEQPIWMTESTVEGAVSEPILGPKVEISNEPGTSFEPNISSSHKRNDDDIMRTLLVHEKKNNQQTLAATSALVPAASSDDDSSTSESDDEMPKPTKKPITTAVAAVEEMESEDGDEEAMINVGGLKIPFSEVTAQHVEKMSRDEKEEYIRIGQQIHETMYD